jgi:hypothetical protein
MGLRQEELETGAHFMRRSHADAETAACARRKAAPNLTCAGVGGVGMGGPKERRRRKMINPEWIRE